MAGSIEEGLQKLGISPDVNISANNEILYRHRSAPGVDIYWLNNRSDKPTEASISFRVSGKVPEVWDPQTGETRAVSYHSSEGRTEVSLDMESWGAVFVVFSGEAKENSLEIPAVTEREVATIQGSWNLTFEENRGAPAGIELQQLQSWHENEDPGVKYFSGTGTYTTTFTAPELAEGERLVLDLGEVHNIAGVRLNGGSWASFGRHPTVSIWMKR